MNKQEVINEIEKIDYQNLKYNSPERMLSAQKQLIIDIIERLDEPQKVKVKQFVADWFEDHKHNLSNSLWEFTVELNEKSKVTGALYTEFESWFIEHPRAYEFITSMKNGYEVEEEQKFEVIFPNLTGEKDLYLMKFYEKLSITSDRNFYVDQRYIFTEQEIKSIDERYWPFAVPVEEVVEG